MCASELDLGDGVVSLISNEEHALKFDLLVCRVDVEVSTIYPFAVNNSS